jgi:hypothetical protein
LIIDVGVPDEDLIGKGPNGYLSAQALEFGR